MDTVSAGLTAHKEILNREGWVTITARVTPRSRQNTVEGIPGTQELRVRVKEPPVDGKANRAVLSLIADEFSVPTSAVRIIRGFTSRTKSIEIRL